MRNMPFAIYDASIKPLKHKFPALGHKYREWVKAVGGRWGANFRHCSNPRNTRR